MSMKQINRFALHMQLRRDRMFKDRLNPFEIYDDVDLLDRFHFRRANVTDLLRVSHRTRENFAVWRQRRYSFHCLNVWIPRKASGDPWKNLFISLTSTFDLTYFSAKQVSRHVHATGIKITI